MWWTVLFVLVVAVLSGLAFYAYRSGVCRYERRVIEEYEESRRRRQESHPRPAPGANEPLASAAVEEDEFREECAAVLEQLERRRKALRRPQRSGQS